MLSRLLARSKNRYFWPSYLMASLLLVFIPIYQRWFNAESGVVNFITIEFFLFALCGICASWKKVSRFNATVAFLFLALVWGNSQPTSGWGTIFYTNSQIKRFLTVERFQTLIDDIVKRESTRRHNEEM